MPEQNQWPHLIGEYLRYLVAIGRPQTTVRLRRDQVRHLARSINLQPTDITYDDLIAWFGVQQWKPETRRSYRSALRGFFAWAHSQELITCDPAIELPQIKQGKPAPRPAPDSAWLEALQIADTRVTLMLRLAAEAGLRRSEVAAVHVRDLRRGDKGAQLLVHGKGDKDRVVPITRSLAGAIIDFCPEDRYLFPSLDRWGNVLAPHVSDHHVGKLISALMPPGWSMHKLRHRYASRGLAGTNDLVAVGEALGHVSVATTQRYVKITRDKVRAVSEAAAPPKEPA